MGRRSRGEGSIYKRNDGRWCGKYVDANGKTRYVYGKTKVEVRTKLTKAIADKDSGIVYDAGTLNVGEYLDRWLDSVKDTLRPGAFRRYEESCRIHIKPTLDRVRLSRLNALQLQNLYSNKLDTGLSPRTIQIIHATLYKALKQAVRWSLIPRNVAEAVTPPRPIKQEIQPLTQAQMKALLDEARSDKLYALYVLAVTTGMRQGEILGLQRKDLDLNTATLKVNRSVYNGVVSPPKTTAGRRTIRLSKLAVAALKAHGTRQAQQCTSEWVFSTGKGTPLSCHNLHSRSWKPLLRKAELAHSTRFHDLRHSALTLLISRGIPLKVVSEMAGHANVSITLSVYGHVMPDMQSTAANGMDEALS